MSFAPPTHFHFPTTLTRTWHIGHMSSALKSMQNLIQTSKIDFLIEVRDSRLPLTSINPTFEKLLRSVGTRVGRMIVYGKRDLAENRWEKVIGREVLRGPNLGIGSSVDGGGGGLSDIGGERGKESVWWIDTRVDKQVKEVHQDLINRAKRFRDMHRERMFKEKNQEISEQGDKLFKILIVGMPNVGKSSLLNALRRVGVRRGKAAVTGSSPGLTRSISEVVKISEDPLVYVKDTPGIMPPFLGSGAIGAERGMLLGITSGIKESLYPIETLAEYLLWRLTLRCFYPNESQHQLSWTDLMELLGLSKDLPPSTPFHEIIIKLSKRIGAMLPGGIPDTSRTCKFLLEQFRKGKYGPWTLDHFPPPPLPLSSIDNFDQQGFEMWDDGMIERGGEMEMDYAIPEQKRDPKFSILDVGWKKGYKPNDKLVGAAVRLALRRGEEVSTREWRKRHGAVKKVMRQEGLGG